MMNEISQLTISGPDPARRLKDRTYAACLAGHDPSVEPYLYPGDKLDDGASEVRLLSLLPGRKGDQIQCELRNASLDTIQTCEALSYAWGSPDSTHTISVNGGLFKVRENLYNALDHLRFETSERILWNDALCIDQENIAERNSQVQRMGSIFGKASKVIVWVGLETTSIKAAFAFLRQSYARSPFNRKELMEHPGWNACKELCDIEYFKRVWIVQEICLAQRVIIVSGTEKIPWIYISELRKARKNIWPQYLSSGERDFMRSLPARIDEQKEGRPTKGCVLWALMESFKYSHCQEVHDKMYGFLGLSTDCGNMGLKVDYSSSIESLYRELMWFYHDHFRDEPSRGAQLFALSAFLQELFSNHMTPGTPERLELESRGSIGSINAPKSSMEIAVHGHAAITQFLSTDDAKQYEASQLVDFLAGKIPHSDLGYWRDLVDPNLKGVETNETSHVFVTTSDYMLHHPVGDDDELSAQVSNKTDQTSVFLATFPYWIESMTVIGIAPRGSQVGDIVCTFLESRLMMVMRFSSEAQRYNLVGYGIMEDFDKKLGGIPALLQYAETPKDHWQGMINRRLNGDKTIESVLQNSRIALTTKNIWPAILTIDLANLQAITRPKLSRPS